MLSLSSVLLATSSFVATALAHGQIHHVSSGGQTMAAPNIYYAGDKANAGTPVRVMYKASSPAFVLPSGFSDPNQMSCEGSGNAPAPTSIPVAAGGSLDIFWAGATGELMGQGGVTAYDPWVHAMGPVMDYITSCNGPCNKFNSVNAGWTKLAGAGIDFSQSISGSLRTAMTNKPEKYYPLGAGLWAMAKLVQDGSKWTVNIPEGLAPGEYIVRHELAAIHNPLNSDPTTGPQVYISCTQVKVTGSGTKTLPAGTKSSQLYDPQGAFAKFNVYNQDSHSFQVPGPAVWDGVSSGGGSSSSAPSSPPASSSGGDNGGDDGGDDSDSSDSNRSPSPAPAPAPAKASPKPASTTPKPSAEKCDPTPAPPPPEKCDPVPPPPPPPSPKQCKSRRKARRDAAAAANPLALAYAKPHYRHRRSHFH